MTTQTKVVTPIESAYFAEEDVMDIRSKLIDQEYIDTNPAEHDPLVDPVVLALALDRLIDTIIGDILLYPGEMLFGDCDGSHRRDFERAWQQVVNDKKAGR
jgi:hypothetical protein